MNDRDDVFLSATTELKHCEAYNLNILWVNCGKSCDKGWIEIPIHWLIFLLVLCECFVHNFVTLLSSSVWVREIWQENWREIFEAREYFVLLTSIKVLSKYFLERHTNFLDFLRHFLNSKFFGLKTNVF